MRFPQTIGDDHPLPGIGVFHCTFLSRAQCSGRSPSDETPCRVGPRKPGQFSAQEIERKHDTSANVRAVHAMGERVSMFVWKVTANVRGRAILVSAFAVASLGWVAHPTVLTIERLCEVASRAPLFLGTLQVERANGSHESGNDLKSALQPASWGTGRVAWSSRWPIGG